MRVGLKKQDSDKSFTLVELVIVAVIVGILAAVGLVHYRNTVTRAKAAKAKHGISLIVQAEKVYMTQYGVYKNIGRNDEGRTNR